MWGIPKLLIIFFVLFSCGITEGTLQGYHRTGCDHVISLKVELSRVVLLTFFQKSILKGDGSPKTVYIRLVKLAVRNGTNNKQAVAIFHYASFDAKGQTVVLSFFVCLEKYSIDEKNKHITVELNPTHVPVLVEGEGECERRLKEFEKVENGWKYPPPEIPQTGLPVKSNIRNRVKTALGIGGGVLLVGGTIGLTVLFWPAGLALIALECYVGCCLSRQSLIDEGYIKFEMLIKKIDGGEEAQVGGQKIGLPIVDEKSGPQDENKDTEPLLPQAKPQSEMHKPEPSLHRNTENIEVNKVAPNGNENTKYVVTVEVFAKY